MNNPRRPTARKPVVLLVEDDENQVLLSRLAIEEAGLDIDLQVVDDGVNCMAYLARAGRDGTTPWPDLVLMDVNLPRMNSKEVMAKITADETLRSLVVVVLTTSVSPDDLQRMYSLRCNSYVVKPTGFDGLVETMRQIGHYWLKVSTLPGAPERGRG